MEAPTGLGPAVFSRSELLASLEEFTQLYSKRPIQDNAGGMSSTHLFLFWSVLRALKPRAVIESGVWRGQGTWLIEQACPDAAIFCIDLDWSNLVYRSKRATYLDRDITLCDWSNVPKRDTVVFFDDHIDSMKRCRDSLGLGFRHLVFEDNYPYGRGDCYSLQEVFAHTGHRAFPGWRAMLSRMLGRLQDRTIKPNTEDEAYVRSIAEVYEVMPPIFKLAQTRWGDTWNQPTPAPLLTQVGEPWQQILFDEAKWYTWLCYLRLR